MWLKSFLNDSWDPDFTTIGTPLNTGSRSNVAVKSRVPGIVDIFGVGADRSCLRKHWGGNLTSGTWTLPGTGYIIQGVDFSSSIETMSLFSLRLDVFGLDAVLRLQQKTWLAGQISPWTEIIGQSNVRPFVIIITTDDSISLTSIIEM